MSPEPLSKKELMDLEEILETERELRQIQESTKTTFAAFQPIHEYLRSKSRFYYHWHLNEGHRVVHATILVSYLFLIAFFVSSQLGYISIGKAASNIAKLLNYQAKLVDSNGKPVADGNYNIKFTIYDAPTGGNCVYTARGGCPPDGTPQARSVPVADGVLTVVLGDTANGDKPITLDFTTDSFYLGVTVGSDSEMTPRRRIGASGYAFNADTVDGYHAGTGPNQVLALDTNGNINIAGGASLGSSLTVTGATVLNSSLTVAGASSQNGNVTLGDSAADTLTVNATPTFAANTTFNGNLTANGNLTFGDASSDTINVNGRINSHLIPATNNTQDLGTAALRWRNGYFGSGLTAGGTMEMTGFKLTTVPTAGFVLTSDASGVGTWQSTPNPSGWTDDGAVVRLITTSDSVGIGTTIPGAKLEIKGSTADNAAAGLNVTDSNGVSKLYVRNDGNIGVGTTTPGNTLHVNGGIRVATLAAASQATPICRDGSNDVSACKNVVANTTVTIFGYGAGAVNSGTNNVFIGLNAANSNTTGFSNVAMGWESLILNTTGYDNTAIGAQALRNNTTGFYNTAIGYAALFDNGPGNNGNTAVGLQALNANHGDRNSALGLNSLQSNTTGTNNNAFGWQAMQYNTTGAANVAFGTNALNANTTANFNTAIGGNALISNTTGASNTALGLSAGNNNVTGSSNVFLGYQAGYNETGSNKLYIANSSTDPALIYGNFATTRVGIGTNSPGNTLEVNGGIRVATLAGASATTVCRDGNNDLSTCASSRSYKKDILYLTENDYANVLNDIANTNLARYRMYYEPVSRPPHIGVIAEESPAQIQYIDEHDKTNVDWFSMWAYSWAGIKELNKKISPLVDSATAVDSFGNLTVKQAATFNGTLLVKDAAVFEKTLVVKNTATFQKDIAVKGLILGSEYTRGSIVLTANQNTVAVNFSAPGSAAPVSVTANADYNTNIWISNVSQNGFTLNVGVLSSQNQTIYWQAQY